jgi:hypothetical protein
MPTIKKHETLFDFVLANAGTIEAMFDVALANGLSITDTTTTPGATLAVDTSKEYSDDVLVIEAYKPEAPEKELKNRQTPFDFITQHTGSFESIIEMALLNRISITEDVAPGTMLFAKPVKGEVVDYFDIRNLDINTDVRPVQGGIGFMRIGSTFKVS